MNQHTFHITVTLVHLPTAYDEMMLLNHVLYKNNVYNSNSSYSSHRDLHTFDPTVLLFNTTTITMSQFSSFLKLDSLLQHHISLQTLRTSNLLGKNSAIFLLHAYS